MQYGRYRIVKQLGHGTMGVVYRAHDPQINRMVALKVLRPERVNNQTFKSRFLKEARAIGRLSHPNIVTIYDIGEDHKTAYIAMEFLEGEPLNETIRSGRLSIAQRIEIARQVAHALDYAYQNGIVHRDIKPSNIIITRHTTVKLTDFGIAHMVDSAATVQTQTGEILGTPIYMAPEQVMGQKVDGRSDLFSLGVILYELVVGHRPFSGNNIAALFRAITQDTPTAPVDSDPSINPSLSDLIMRSLDKAPEARFQTGAQMAQALAGVLDEGVSDAFHPSAPRRRAAWFIGTTLILLIFLTTGAYFFFFRPSASNVTDNRTLISTGQPSADTMGAKNWPVGIAVLQISSEPLGASVYIDTELKGVTPLDVDLPLGKYELRLDLEKHLQWEAQIDLDTPGAMPLHVPLRPKK